jgi:hypothetical protein
VPAVFAKFGDAVRSRLPYWARPAFDATCRDCAAKVDTAVAARDKAAFDRYARETADLAIGRAEADRAAAARAGDAIGVDRADWYLGVLRKFRALYAPEPAPVTPVPVSAEPAPTPSAPPAPAAVSAEPASSPPADGEYGDGGEPESAAVDPKDESPNPVTPDDRRFPDVPETISNEMSVVAGGDESPGIDRARLLRRHFAEIGRLALRREDGSPVATDAEVAAYIEGAKPHIRPEHFGVFVLTVAAVRAGILPWPEAAERLTEHYAPTTLGQAVFVAVMDAFPVIGEAKAAYEFGEAALNFAKAVENGDADGAEHYAEELIFLAATFLPVGRGVKIAGNVPGLKKLLRDINAATTEAERKAIWDTFRKATGLEGHHIVMRALGGRDLGVLYMLSPTHHELHKRFQEFMKDSVYKHLYPVAGRPGRDILREFGLGKVVEAHAAFYRQHLRGEYADIAKEFFRLFPRLR